MHTYVHAYTCTVCIVVCIVLICILLDSTTSVEYYCIEYYHSRVLYAYCTTS